MIRQIKTKVMAYWEEWIAKRISKTNPQILGSQNIYIIPSGFGWAYGVVVLSLFSGAINYQVSTVFLMSFILAIVGFISAWEAHANLKGLSIKLVSVEDTYEGMPAQVRLLIQSNNRMHFGLDFRLNNQSVTRLEKIPPQGLRFILPLATTRRGCYTLPKITISSFFLLACFRYGDMPILIAIIMSILNLSILAFGPPPFIIRIKRKQLLMEIMNTMT